VVVAVVVIVVEVVVVVEMVVVDLVVGFDGSCVVRSKNVVVDVDVVVVELVLVVEYTFLVNNIFGRFFFSYIFAIRNA
jgi:hypothetical protein